MTTPITIEDLEQMKQLIRSQAKCRNGKQILEAEHKFVEEMAKKYGKAEAVELLIKVWKTAAMLREKQQEEES